MDLRLHHLIGNIIWVVLGLIQQGSEAGSARRLSKRVLSSEASLLLEPRRGTFLLSLTAVVNLDTTREQSAYQRANLMSEALARRFLALCDRGALCPSDTCLRSCLLI